MCIENSKNSKIWISKTTRAVEMKIWCWVKAKVSNQILLNFSVYHETILDIIEGPRGRGSLWELPKQTARSCSCRQRACISVPNYFYYDILHWEKYILVSPFFRRNSPIIYDISTPENPYRTFSYFLSDFTCHRKMYYKIGGFFRKNIIQFPIQMSN